MRSLEESVWADVVRATGLDASMAPLRPVGDHPVTDEESDEALVKAAGLALGRAEVGVTMLSGAGDRGILAQLGSDQQAVAVAMRAVAADPRSEGSEPMAVPGVRLGVRPATGMVAELMRLVPPGGGERELPPGSVSMRREDALVVVRAAGTDDEVALAAAHRAGFDDVPPVLRAVARGTTASVTVTISTCATPLHAVRQWLLTDRGWVSLSMLGDRVVHTARSRDELAAETTALLAGAWDAALAARRRAS